MCKIAACTKITDENRADVWVFMQLLGELISKGNDDGLGYASFDKKGNLFGEKWLINGTAFKDLTQIKSINSAKMNLIYNFFGDRVVRDEAQAIILHTRAATCTKGIENTHPFVDDKDSPKVAIIHNGMIYNEQLFTRKYSTCDSEVIAHLYSENKVSSDLKKLNDFSAKMKGWFTVLALSKDDSGKMVMDAFTDSGRLGSYFIQELNTRVYSTYADDVYRVAKQLGLTPVDCEKMDSDTAFRVDVLTGEQIEFTKIKSSTEVQVHYPPGYWEGWENVATMEGNLSDEEFKNKWFANGMRGWRGHHGD